MFDEFWDYCKGHISPLMGWYFDEFGEYCKGIYDIIATILWFV